ncbi:MAG TPA: multifunctional CCA tRNA nucleotidyl transferase/2'3'-cyclic phosphodiesterase/2'nucleotidase/phosphatase, partial [Rudaea sp.]|nr:multifunctional CCA tRNA nucleotidyl transferase/2'3'-cyclic phosphodiesterase/2'nucleotidase/phosphatase [Rudaea sp.]
LTPADKLPSHPAHEHAGIAPVAALCTRLKVPNEYAALAQLVCRLHLLAHTAFQLRPATVLGLFEQLDAFRKTGRLEQFLLACEADKRGRLGLEESDYPQARFLRSAFAAARQVASQAFIDQGLTGTAVGEAIRDARVQAIAAVSAERAGS